MIYFESFGVKHIPKETKMGNKNIVTNVYIIQAHHSIMYGYCCTGFIDFLLKDKRFLDYTNLFSLNEFEKNEKIILKYIQ